MFRSYTYTGDTKIAIMVNKIRQVAPPKVYIAEGTAITYISYMRRNPRWGKIEGQFGHIDVSRRPDGIYLFPVFSRTTCDHWHTVILRKRALLWFGWNVDTLRFGEQERLDYVKKTLGKVITERVQWTNIEGFKQEEVECGPRTMCNIVYIVQQLKKNREINEVVRELMNKDHISSQEATPKIARQVCE